jgi:hypothetical protein
MPFELPADPGDPGRRSTGIGRVDGGRTGFRHRLVRDGVQVLAHGALVCPECNLPIAIAGGSPAAAVIRCGFCDHTAPIRAFLAVDVYDTVRNEAQLVARIGRGASTQTP